ncbi:MAG: DUF5671 domain-containing protein [Patescibacteria group bacterium]
MPIVSQIEKKSVLTNETTLCVTNLNSNNSAKFAFFYMLSLVALVFMSLSTGMIIFQIINKNIADAINQYDGNYSPDALKFAISALIISAPIFYFTIWRIFKNLISGILSKDSAVRRWLTYFILFVASVVVIGWLIGVFYNFLQGELTIKFILKAITTIFISSAIFSFYLYDIKREAVNKNNKVILSYFYCSLGIIIIVFVASLFFVESPTETRNRRLDDVILEKFDKLDTAIQHYYVDKNKLPDNFKEIMQAENNLTNDDLKDSVANTMFDYKIFSNTSYELCANFRVSNKNSATLEDEYNNYKERWPHESGYQCLKQRVSLLNKIDVMTTPIQVER